jgi:predicted DCC family thiol-disulfide oxidoreductase YuxK
MQVLLYDGLCGFCDRTVQLILRYDRNGAMKFAPLQGAFAARVLQERPELQSVDSLILVDTSGGDTSVRVRSAAVLAIAEYLGGPWRLVALMRILPPAVRDWGYDLFARHRLRFFGRYDACPVPGPGTRARFID